MRSIHHEPPFFGNQPPLIVANLFYSIHGVESIKFNAVAGGLLLKRFSPIGSMT
jgi:hypothetical protein